MPLRLHASTIVLVVEYELAIGHTVGLQVLR